MVYPNYSTLTVVNVIAAFVPQKVLTFFCDANAHAEGIKASRFGEVADVEGNFLLLELSAAVLNAEIKPLVMARGVGIDPHVEVVLVGSHLAHDVQVAALEEGVKFKFLV
jgi:hypothetical protein